MGKKEEFYHTRETHYQDWEGNWHPFSIVDHDIKTSTATVSKGKSKETKEREIEEESIYKKRLLDQMYNEVTVISAFPVVFAAKESDDFVSAALYAEVIIKDGDKTRWDTDLLKGLGEINKDFIYNLMNRVWNFWIKEEHLNKGPSIQTIEDLSYKEWMKDI